MTQNYQIEPYFEGKSRFFAKSEKIGQKTTNFRGLLNISVSFGRLAILEIYMKFQMISNKKNKNFLKLVNFIWKYSHFWNFQNLHFFTIFLRNLEKNFKIGVKLANFKKIFSPIIFLIMRIQSGMVLATWVYNKILFCALFWATTYLGDFCKNKISTQITQICSFSKYSPK